MHDYFSIHELVAHVEETAYDPNLLYVFFTTMILNTSLPLIQAVLSVASPKKV